MRFYSISSTDHLLVCWPSTKHVSKLLIMEFQGFRNMFSVWYEFLFDTGPWLYHKYHVSSLYYPKHKLNFMLPKFTLQCNWTVCPHCLLYVLPSLYLVTLCCISLTFPGNTLQIFCSNPFPFVVGICLVREYSENVVGNNTVSIRNSKYSDKFLFYLLSNFAGMSIR